jgi:hypothetical protein
MTAVNKLLNVVCACEIRGRLRCSAASIGYRGWIRKGFVHSPVTRLSPNPCQARNYHRRGIPADQRRGRELRSARAGSSTREMGTSPRRMPVCRICVELASPAGAHRRRRESRLIRPASDIGPRRSPAVGHVRVFSSRERALGRGVVPCFPKKQENTGEGRADCTVRPRHETTCLAVGPQVDFVARRWHERAARLYLRHER